MKIMKNILSPVAVAAVLGAISAQGATLTLAPNPSFGFSSTDFPGGSTINVPKFDPALGTLTSITLGALGELSSTIKNNSPTAEDLSGSVNTTFTLSGFTGGPVTLTVNNPFSFTGGSALGSGVTSAPFNASSSTTTPASPIAGLDVAQWSGAGNLAVGVASATSQTVSGGGGNNTIVNNGKVSLTVTYTYTPGSNVPEPKVYGAIGALLSLGVLGYRQFRSKKA